MDTGSYWQILSIAIPIFFLTMFIEWRISKGSTKSRGYIAKDTVASLAMGVGYLLIQLPLKGMALGLYLWLYNRRLFDFEFGVMSWVLLIVAEDFCFYWYHRTHHTVRILWASHVNHHSSKFFNLSTALRQPWTAPFIGPFFWLPLPFLGFPVEWIIIQQVLNLLYQYWTHTELIGSLGWFGLIFNTPSHHRVHHATNARYLDKNLAGTLIIWDRMFGTFEPEKEAPVYGLVHDISSHNPFYIAFHEFGAIGRDLWLEKSWRKRFWVVFGPPGGRDHQAS
jgi:sterol desaturase/sphingolipid hydroxylase (fatty acid hydroxylase superfamily)